MRELSQTHLDAMAATNALGFRYIWKDALFIIQDSEDDLKEELAKMGSIYQGSVLTIDANYGSNPDSGLFVHRDPLWYSPCKLKISITLQDDMIDELVYAYPKMEEKSGELYTRAWVLQEEVLSERHLIFGKNMMSWCCTTCRANEACAAPLKQSGSDFAELRRWLFSPHSMSPTLHSTNGRMNHFDSWYALVENFSTRYLTYQSDILKALEGLAQIMKDTHGCRYLCGLWEEDLQCGLTWQVCRRLQSVRNDPEVLKDWALAAPSWSWASCPSAVIEFYRWKDRQVVHLGVHYSTSQITGQLSATTDHGVLQLKGALKKARMRILDEDGRVELDDLNTGQRIGYGMLDNRVDRAELHIRSRPSILRPVSCLLTCAFVKDRWSLICLMLRPTWSGGNEYCRIGLMIVSDEKWFGDLKGQKYFGHGAVWDPLPAEFEKSITTINLA